MPFPPGGATRRRAAPSRPLEAAHVRSHAVIDARARASSPRRPPRASLGAHVAHLIPLTTLPSGLCASASRRTLLGMLDHGRPVHVTGWESVYLVCLSLTVEGLALLAFGLVTPWGERVPAWIPRLRGRRIPPRLVVTVAGTGAVLVTSSRSCSSSRATTSRRSRAPAPAAPWPRSATCRCCSGARCSPLSPSPTTVGAA